MTTDAVNSRAGKREETDRREASHPLAATLNRIPVLDWQARTDMGALESGWLRAADLLHDDILLEQALARQAREYPHMESRTRGSYLVGEYSWYVPAAAITAYLLERRVPDLTPENLALRFSKFTWQEGEYSGESVRLDARFLGGRFAALPEDPDAAHPDAMIVADEEALREWLRAALEAHFAPLIERIFRMTRLGRQAQWNLVADACAALFLYVGKMLGEAERAQRAGLAFVKAPDSPMKNPKTGYFTLEYQGHCETFRARGGCCRYYTVSENAEKCSLCVLVKPEERDQRLLHSMSGQFGQETVS